MLLLLRITAKNEFSDMAKQSKQKRTEALSIRITPDLKYALSLLSNIYGLTISTIIENMLETALEHINIDRNIVYGEIKYNINGAINIKNILKLVVNPNPIITRLRLFYILPSGLTEKEKFISEAIVKSAIFYGKQSIFKPKYSVDNTEIPNIDLEKITEHEEMLSNYAEFMMHNSQRPDGGIPINYETYLKLKSGEKITISLNDLMS